MHLPYSKSSEEVAESPVKKQVPGFADFMSPKGSSKKKRHLPIAPGLRGRAMSGDDGLYPVITHSNYVIHHRRGAGS